MTTLRCLLSHDWGDWKVDFVGPVRACARCGAGERMGTGMTPYRIALPAPRPRVIYLGDDERLVEVHRGSSVEFVLEVRGEDAMGDPRWTSTGSVERGNAYGIGSALLHEIVSRLMDLAGES